MKDKKCNSGAQNKKTQCRILVTAAALAAFLQDPASARVLGNLNLSNRSLVRANLEMNSVKCECQDVRRRLQTLKLSSFISSNAT